MISRLVILFLVFAAFLNIANISDLKEIQGDTASLFTMATAPIFGLGSPYKDYWEFKPPGIMLFIGIFVKLFGYPMLSLKLLQFFLLISVGLLTYLVSIKIFSKPISYLVFGSAVLVTFSPHLYDLFLPSELFGLGFSLLGLVIVIYLKNGWPKFYLSSFFIFTASQMKDPFVLGIIVILPQLFNLFLSKKYKDFVLSVISCLLGVLTVIIVLFFYLVIHDSLGAYMEVLRFKSEYFKIFSFSGIRNFQYGVQTVQDSIRHFKYFNTAPLFLWFGVLVLYGFKFKHLYFKAVKQNYSLKIMVKANNKLFNMLSIIFYYLGSFLGLAVGYRFGNHYSLQTIIPLYFFQGIFINSIYSKATSLTKTAYKKTMIKILIIFLAIMFFLPQPIYLNKYLFKGFNFQRVIQNILKSDREPSLLVNKDGCTLSVYGWGVSQTYFYTKTKPCSRFFIPNIVVENWQKDEYRDSLMTNPPAVIFYSKNEADMDIDLFEKEVVNLSQIIDKCYRGTRGEENVYYPIAQKKEDLSICFRKYIL